MDAMEVSHPMLSSILDTQEVLNLTSPIHMLQRLTNVFIDQKSQLLIADTEASIFHKEMKMNLLKDFTMLDLLLFLSKLLLVSRTMLEVFTQSPIVVKLLKMLTTLSWPLVMELKRESSSGTSRTLGGPLGELKVISKWKKVLTCVLLPNVTLIL